MSRNRWAAFNKTSKIAFSLIAIFALVLLVAPQVSAVKATDFNPGRIIDDEIFYDTSTMTAKDIDDLIKDKAPTCDLWGTKPQEDNDAPKYKGLTRAEFGALRQQEGSVFYHGAPFVCIQHYYEDPDTGKTSFDTGGEPFEGGLSVGEMIYQASMKYGINPQVMVTMLRKESTLFNNTWPVRSQYNTAFGYACPDSSVDGAAECSKTYAGFYKQVTGAAWQLQRYKTHNSKFNYHPGMNNKIYYYPQNTNTPAACKGLTATVFIENIATASLYIYTPYVPNEAALKAYPGTGDACSSYGNRNFFMMFNQWFGSTYYNGTTEPENPGIENPDDTTPRSIEEIFPTLNINEDTKLLLGLPLDATLADLKDLAHLEGEIIEATNEKLTTGTKITVKLADDIIHEYTVVLRGDVNGDGKIDISDLVLISRYIAGAKTLAAPHLNASDTNKDGKTDISDLVLTSRHIAKIKEITP